VRKYLCFLSVALLLAGCNVYSLLVNDSDLSSVSEYYNGKKLIKPSLSDKYKYLSDISRETVPEKDYLVFGNDYINYNTNVVKIIKEETRNNNKYGVVSVNVTSKDGLNTTKTFTQTWILENSKWKIISFPKDIYKLKSFYSNNNDNARENKNNDDGVNDENDKNKSADYLKMAKLITEKDPYNISANGVIILSTKNMKKRNNIISNIAYNNINQSDTEYINISKIISDDRAEYEDSEKEKERLKAIAVKDKYNEDRLFSIIGQRAANSAIGNEALSMYQYRIFRQSNGSAGYMDYVRSRANYFQDSDGKSFLISALCDGVRSYGNQRLINANVLGIRPMDFDSPTVKNLCN